MQISSIRYAVFHILPVWQSNTYKTFLKSDNKNQ